MNKASPLAIVLAAAALGLPPMPAQAQVISACVQRNNGSIRILEPGQTCANNSYYLEWNHPQVIPPAPTLQTIEIIGFPIPGTWVARAFCPAQWKVTGGGGTTLNNTPLTQNHPIATQDGVFASDGTAIGWQAGATTEGVIYAWVICSRVQ
jgi:hypothetical protein